MVIEFEAPQEPVAVKKGTTLKFEKLGKPGSRRWHVVYTRRGEKFERREPVRNVKQIRCGRVKL